MEVLGGDSNGTRFARRLGGLVGKRPVRANLRRHLTGIEQNVKTVNPRFTK